MCYCKLHKKKQRTKKKKDSKCSREPMMKWHSTLRNWLRLEDGKTFIKCLVDLSQYSNTIWIILPFFTIDTEKKYEHIESKNPAWFWMRKATVYSPYLLLPWRITAENKSHILQFLKENISFCSSFLPPGCRSGKVCR